MENATLLNNITPERLTDTILNGVKIQLESFKKDLEPKGKETYLTRIQTATTLSISLTTLNDWSRKSILHPMKLGCRTYYKLSEIENKLNNSNTL